MPRSPRIDRFQKEPDRSISHQPQTARRQWRYREQLCQNPTWTPFRGGATNMRPEESTASKYCRAQLNVRTAESAPSDERQRVDPVIGRVQRSNNRRRAIVACVLPGIPEVDIARQFQALAVGGEEHAYF